MALDPLTAVLDLANGVGSKLIDKIWPDKTAQAAEREQAALALLQVQNDQDVKVMTASLSAIIAEAQSTDPWTSRARPSFMYVIYVLILAGIPIGILAAFRPDIANNIASGLNLWLRAIPDSLYTLFGVGYLGYTGARTIEKSKGVA
jgi:capsular polysaccharide biosynthesis protein